MFDEETLARSRDAEARWQAAYDRIRDRFGETASARATRPETDSGLPIKNCYFPHDIEGLDLGGAPGSYPFT
ncbi:MAG: methylmalonyl-CoA mutase, partial [Candidatus Dormibacteria bacterium]